MPSVLMSVRGLQANRLYSCMRLEKSTCTLWNFILILYPVDLYVIYSSICYIMWIWRFSFSKVIPSRTIMWICHAHYEKRDNRIPCGVISPVVKSCFVIRIHVLLRSDQCNDFKEKLICFSVTESLCIMRSITKLSRLGLESYWRKYITESRKLQAHMKQQVF